ncbi:MAG: hypothetical protein AAGD01_18440 [Acidobacteriota bacterium]
MIAIALQVLWLYLAVGALFALLFQFRGLVQVDSGVEDSSLWTRLLITPGIVALWPLMARKWARARHGESGEGAAEAPVTARGLRLLHRRLVWILPLAAIVAALAISQRPAVPGSGEQAPDLGLSPNALPATVLAPFTPFEGIPLEISLRGQAVGRVQVEARSPRDLAVPSAWLYFSVEDLPSGVAATGTAEDSDGLPPGSVLLGPVWGPGVQRYALPQGETGSRGSLSLYSLGWGRRVGSFSLGANESAAHSSAPSAAAPTSAAMPTSVAIPTSEVGAS